MRKIRYNVAMSLDGFIAGPKGEADWIVADRLPVRFQMQLHKALWGNAPGR